MRRLVAPATPACIERGPMPTFSIVIPAYQAAGFIAEAVESVLAQTLPAHEVIVCDDGSTDDLASALAPFREHITLLRRPHRGVSAARNAALRLASGDFVVMLDADDVCEPERLRALAELAAARPDLDILGTDLRLERAGAPEGRFYEFTDFPVEHQRLGILETCFVACPALRRARVLEIGAFDESLELGEDWDLFMRLILDGSAAGIVDQPLLRYRLHDRSATANRPRALWARVAVLEKTRLHPGLTPEELRFLDRCLVRARARSALNDAAVVAASRTRGSRRSLLALAATSNIPPTTRLTLTAAALTPVAAIPVLAWKERRVARSSPRKSMNVSAPAG
jgi:glycosyltransferase involved in cell wall biosynthesis